MSAKNECIIFSLNIHKGDKNSFLNINIHTFVCFSFILNRRVVIEFQLKIKKVAMIIILKC